MRELALVGCVALVFGLGSYRATDHFGLFAWLNLVLGAGTLGLALALGAGRLVAAGSPAARRLLARGVGRVLVAILAAAAAERAIAAAGLRFDWTLEERFEPAPATQRALEQLCGPVEMLLFYDPRDPRVRRTRLLVETLARHGDVIVRPLALDDAPDEVDFYGVGTSNSLVIRLRQPAGVSDHFELAERPTEGAIFEALYRLCSTPGGVLLALRGDGEGDLGRGDDVGFAGLAAALATEGYRLRSQVTAGLQEVPGDVDAVLAIAPRRRLPDPAVAALERYLERGGRLIALLEPGARSGLETLLARWGLESDPSVVIDPGSGGAGARGTGIAAERYESHPITAGLDASRMTWFQGARAFRLRQPTVEDRVTRVVLSSPEAWLSDDPARDGQGAVAGPDTPRAYRALAAAGRYPREGRETRIFAVGDADFASNRHLRTLYNLDLVLNGVHWTLAREPAITLRPKLRDAVQFPLPVTDSLHTLYGVGLLLPELLLVAGGVVWLRRRGG